MLMKTLREDVSVKQTVKIAKIEQLSDGRWRVYSKKGRNLGTYESKGAAEERLSQVEMFKHMKLETNKKRRKEALGLISLCATAPDTSDTYSSMMRKINKKNPESMKSFMKSFKEAFDSAIDHDLDAHQDVALLEAQKKLSYNLLVEFAKTAQALYADPNVVGKALSDVSKLLLSRVPHDKVKAYDNVRSKLMNMNVSEISSTNLPDTAAYGQIITLMKTLLHGYDSEYIRNVLSSTANNLY